MRRGDTASAPAERGVRPARSLPAEGRAEATDGRREPGEPRLFPCGGHQGRATSRPRQRPHADGDRSSGGRRTRAAGGSSCELLVFDESRWFETYRTQPTLVKQKSRKSAILLV